MSARLAHYTRQPSQSDAIVFEMLRNAAERGDQCPSNYEIAAALDASSVSRGSELLNRLERRGMIKVERGQANRVVTIVETGKRTAGTVSAVHWRFRPENLHRRHMHYPRCAPVADPEPEPIPIAVRRDPCFLCGTRGDVGCKHQVRW